MAWLIPAISAVAGLVGGNVQNKNNIKAQETAQGNAQSMDANAASLGQAQQLYQWVQMMQRYQHQVQNNPNPAQTWNGIQAPGQMQGAIGGGQIGPSGNPQAAPPQAMPSFMPPQATQSPPQQNLIGMQSAQMQQPQQPQQQQMGSQGIPLRYLQHLFAGGRSQ